jgi:predicted amidohydrolase YtcJ
VPDLLVVAPITTCDPLRPRAEAALVRGGRFLVVGSRLRCEDAAAPGATVVEAGGATPGLADAHGHVALLGRWRREVPLGDAADEAACVARVARRARVAAPGVWIRGSGWDQNRWPEERFPDEMGLTRAVPDHPVALSRVDGHALWVNAAALAAAGIDARTPDPAGGRILRHPDGRPSGVLLDAAEDLVLARIPPPRPGELEDEVVSALGVLSRVGLTSVHDAGTTPEVLAVLRRLAAEDRLPLRVEVMLAGNGPLPELREAMAEARAAPGEGRLAIGAVKLFADGALGSRGAALEEDYADDPGNRGILLLEPAHLAARVRAVVAAGLQPAVHAIGDRALSITLDALEAGGPPPVVRALRPRIEHLQIVRPRHLPRLRALGAVASVQPVHCASDGPWLPARLGEGTERLRGAFAWRTLAAAGVPLAFGSDFPIEAPDPRPGLAAVEARAAPGARPFQPEEALDRTAAIAGFTRGAAWACLAEAHRGVVREGLEADLTLFQGDPAACDPDRLRQLPVTHTIVGGRLQAEAGSPAD